MIRGTVIILGGKQRLLPPLNAAALELHAEFIQKAMAGGLVETDGIAAMSTIAELLHMALLRNYPDMTTAEVKDNLDFGNMQELMTCLFKTSGFVATVEPATGE